MPKAPKEIEWVGLPNGTRIARVTRRGGGRHYEVQDDPVDPSVNGVPLVSSTTALQVINKPALVGWSNRMGREAVAECLRPRVGEVLTEEILEEALIRAKAAPNQRRDTAANFGTTTHALIEDIIAGHDPEVAEPFQQAVQNFKDWFSTAGFVELDLSEQMVYSRTYLYAGTMDARGWKVIDGRRVLVALDWKTSNGIWEEMALQVASYAHAWEEMTGEVAHEAWVVRIGKSKPEFEVKSISLAPAFEGFKAALNLWRALGQEVWEL